MSVVKKNFFEFFVIIFSLIYIIPGWMVLVNSLKNRAQANEYGLGLPSIWKFDNYLAVFNEAKVVRAFFNGFFVAAVSVALVIIFASMASFYIARAGSKGANRSYFYLISGIFIPVALIPTYMILTVLHLRNTYPGLIAIFVTYTIPVSVFIYTGFIKSIPRDMDESAIIDGSGMLRMFFQIIFPLLRSATITVLVVNFMGVWNDVYSWLFFANDEKWSMSMMIYKFYSAYRDNWNLVFADVVITVLPVLAVYIVAQKYLVAGLTAGAVKG